MGDVVETAVSKWDTDTDVDVTVKATPEPVQELPSIIEIASIQIDKLEEALRRWREVLKVIIEPRDMYYTVTWKTGRDSYRKVFALEEDAQAFYQQTRSNPNNREVQLIATLKATGWDKVLDLMGYKPCFTSDRVENVSFKEVGAFLIRTEKSGSFTLEEWYDATGGELMRIIAHVFYVNTRSGRVYVGVGEVSASERGVAHGGHDMRLLALTRATRALAARAMPMAAALLGMESVENVETYEPSTGNAVTVAPINKTMQDFLDYANTLGIAPADALGEVKEFLQQHGPDWEHAMAYLKEKLDGTSGTGNGNSS